MQQFDQHFWRRHAAWPVVLFVLFATVAEGTGLDENLARAWAFDPVTHHFIGSGAGEWWAKDLIHSTGGRLIRLLGGLLVLVWVLSFRGTASLAPAGGLRRAERRTRRRHCRPAEAGHQH